MKRVGLNIKYYEDGDDQVIARLEVASQDGENSESCSWNYNMHQDGNKCEIRGVFVECVYSYDSVDACMEWFREFDDDKARLLLEKVWVEHEDLRKENTNG